MRGEGRVALSSGEPAAPSADGVLRWSVVLPLKRLPAAKTRLRALPAPSRAALVLAMAADTALAALRCPAVGAVWLVTDDPAATAAGRALGCRVLPDAPDGGLNAALTWGEWHAVSTAPGWAVAALTADLPALRPDELGRALAEAAGHPRAHVPDAAGTGTTLLTARPGERLQPAYGAGSAARHGRSGAVPIEVAAASGLRQDVDTPADVARVGRLGPGTATAAVLRRLAGAESPVAAAGRGHRAPRRVVARPRPEPCTTP